jgi:hypothetical protein
MGYGDKELAVNTEELEKLVVRWVSGKEKRETR